MQIKLDLWYGGNKVADIKLFKISGKVEQLPSGNVTLERDLQIVIENNMQEFFGVTFLASEFSTNNGGRMDSIGIDENNCPVIFEYKRSQNENVINQGLFYLDWLLMHKDSFKVLVIEVLGLDKANEIDWSMPRVICIAGDFNKYDECAINQMDKNISLIRYKKFGDDLLMFEQLNQVMVKRSQSNLGVEVPVRKNSKEHITYASARHVKGFSGNYSDAGEQKKELYNDIKDYILSLGDDISETELKLYVAFKKIKNFICAQVYASQIILTLKLDPLTIQFEGEIARDVSNKGHWGTGDVELIIKSKQDFEKVKSMIDRAYLEN